MEAKVVNLVIVDERKREEEDREKETKEEGILNMNENETE